jgi:hypothetical protein
MILADAELQATSDWDKGLGAPEDWVPLGTVGAWEPANRADEQRRSAVKTVAR